MQNPSVLNSTETMSSLEIAKLTGKEHRNVLADIRKMLMELEIGDLNFQSSYLSTQNKPLPCFDLPKRECDILVSGYEIKYRAVIVDRWHELEKNTPRDFAAALRLAADKEEALLIERKLTALNAPIVQFGNQVAKSADSIEIGHYAKLLSNQHDITIGGNKLREYLRESGYLMLGRDTFERNRPYQSSISSGNFEEKYVGSFLVTFVTGKGQLSLAAEIINAFQQSS